MRRLLHKSPVPSSPGHRASGPGRLEVTGVTAGYGQSTVLRNASIVVEEGTIVSMIGPNGAGKSTLLRALSGLLRVRAGSVVLSGQDVTRLSTTDRTRSGLVLCPEGRQLFPSLSVRDNLRLGALSCGRRQDDEALAMVLELFPRVGQRLDQKVGTMSGGEQQMVAIGRALMARPRVLLLDEPSLGLAIGVVQAVADALQRLRSDGISCLIVEQDPTLPSLVSDYVYYCHEGTVSDREGGDVATTGGVATFFERALEARRQARSASHREPSHREMEQS
jgi:branched-chain amino acid transport system ATP-binding protein